MEVELNNNKGNSKCNKKYEKAPILRCKFLHQYLEFKNKISSLHPAPIQKFSGIYLFLFPIFYGDMCNTV